MSEKMNFIRPRDLVIIESEYEFILRKGFIHINELVIDKLGSSKDFSSALHELIKNGGIELNEHDTTYEDFLKLTKFGFIEIGMNNKFLVLINNNYKNTTEFLCGEKIKIGTIEDVFDLNDMKAINECKDATLLNNICNKSKKKFAEYNHIYYIDDFCNLNRLRGFNRLMNMLNIENTIGFMDNNNIYLTGIKPRYTGCYECLEKHIITKFSGTMSEYINQYNYSFKSKLDMGDISVLMGLVIKDMDNINTYGSSSLTGNVIHMYTPNFEYSYNINRKSSSCSVCAKLNNVMFEEQNIRSVNVIKEAFLDDKN